ncbi:N-D-ribosylpurine ribohydrolase [Cavenderia fasciculata]|uniref:N-D-ribosylpurine ribohydrolase n=1 Tax=Cavenderia fasciculata TaxID=261658 RepID=F4PYJ2_CACFS|nr:N-D-ribosylpurine ribohydrolase [Cavenderia fasciculata]EGG19258.1 N-D-ribosylpurine ribohydrolase [Cavenderia fasciculata]|eukprot:XP_004357529.1 N-D-ribosylpurine ribohydrolase [Cavenderia fasciculata]
MKQYNHNNTSKSHDSVVSTQQSFKKNQSNGKEENDTDTFWSFALIKNTVSIRSNYKDKDKDNKDDTVKLASLGGIEDYYFNNKKKGLRVKLIQQVEVEEEQVLKVESDEEQEQEYHSIYNNDKKERHDDAFAIMMCGHDPSLNLLGISTVVGNQTVEKTTINALRVCKFSSMEHVDIVKGAGKPVVRDALICPEIHGDTGLDSSIVIDVETKAPLPGKAINVMYEYIEKVFRETGQQTTIIATASLTNVALLFAVYPEIKEMIESVTLLGGAMTTGNIGPVAEFNIMVDPEAAKMCFESGVKIVMVPLEVSHRALIDSHIVDRIQKIGDTNFIKLCVELLKFFAENYKTMFGMEHPPLHDPLAVAHVINPSIFKTRHLRVDVECTSHLSFGQTVCDVWNMSKLPKNVHVAVEVDIDKFFDLLIDSIDKILTILYCQFTFGEELNNLVLKVDFNIQNHLKLVNDLRAAKKIPPLKLSKCLVQVAQNHANYMAKSNKLTNEDPEGGMFDRITKAGQEATNVSTGVAYGSYSDAGTVNQLNSSPSRDNMISETYTQFGVGMKQSSDGTPYWCQFYSNGQCQTK